MKTIKLSLLLCSALLFFSCASILNGKKQNVYLNTNSKNAKVFVNEEEAGKGSSIKTKLLRNGLVQQVRIEEEGYKDEYKVVTQSHKSPFYIMSWVPFAILIYPPFYDIGNKSFDYSKNIDLSTKKTKIVKRTNEQKYVILESTAFDVKKEDLKYKTIKKRNFKNNKEKFSKVETFKEDLNFDNSIFSGSLNKILLKYNYTDTTNVLLKSNVNYLHIKSTVKKVDLQQIKDKIGYFPLDYLVTKTEIEWEILDIYDQSKFKKTISSQSGEFSFNTGSDKEKSPLLMSTEDAITKSFFDFLSTKEVAELIKTKDIKEVKQELLALKKPEAINSVEDALSATVTIKNSKGHGSGCVISNDGYIITNFHVVATEKKVLTIIDRFGKEFTGTVIRKNEKNDLALIKVEGIFPKAFTLPNSKNYTIGDDIFVIGTPKSIELGQTLSKGIISGIRTSQGVNYIQTDASVNGGNSGGSIVSKSGIFLGVINSKVFGTGVEGLGFGSPAEEITSSLQITQ
jgi:serine protease Do